TLLAWQTWDLTTKKGHWGRVGDTARAQLLFDKVEPSLEVASRLALGRYDDPNARVDARGGGAGLHVADDCWQWAYQCGSVLVGRECTQVSLCDVGDPVCEPMAEGGSCPGESSCADGEGCVCCVLPGCVPGPVECVDVYAYGCDYVCVAGTANAS